jgi:hypothetical protein
MSRFTDAMSAGNEALLYAAGEPIEYWPEGDEEAAIDIDAIWTGLSSIEREDSSERMVEIARAEVQIWADGTRGVETLQLKLDCVVHNGTRWVVVEALEAVTGMHRFIAERQKRAVVGNPRGRR